MYIFDNTFQGAKIDVKLVVHAMQTVAIPNYGSISNSAVSAACIMVGDNIGVNPPEPDLPPVIIDPSDMEYSELLEVEVVQPSQPTATKTENNTYYKSYNFSVNDVTEDDELYIHVDSDEEIYIVPENMSVDEFMQKLEAGDLPADTIFANSETVQKLELTSGANSNVTVVTKSSSNITPQVSVYTEPSGELPAIDESGMVYTKLDYEKVNSQQTPTTTTTIPSESVASPDYGYLKAYHFTIENVSETDTMIVYVTGADIIAIAPGYYTIEEALYYVLQGSLPPGAISGNGLSANGIPLAPGDSFEFTVVTQSLSDTPPTIQVYTEPTENLPFAEDGVLYMINEDGESYSVKTAIDKEITTANIKSEIAGKPVTTIYNAAFASCTNLTSVQLGEGVEIIDDSAFYNCTSLTSIIIPNSVTTIYDYAFASCTNLASVDLGEGVQMIGEYAFQSCTSLTEITIPNSVTTIGYSAFSGCTNLTEITLNAKEGYVWAIYSGNSTIDMVVLDAGTLTQTELLTYAKGYYNFKQIPNNADKLNFTLYNDGNSYYVSGVNDKTITYVAIPAEYNNKPVTTIEGSAFYNCTSLKKVTLNTKQGYTWLIDNDMGDVLIIDETTTQTMLLDYLINSGIHFFFQENLVEVDGVYYRLSNVVDKYTVRTADKSITSVNILDEVNGKPVITIDRYAFYNCTSLTSITVPNSVTTIGDQAFQSCTSLTSITIPSSVTTIGSDAFAGCTSLTSITIPNSVTTIGYLAFSGCTSLTSITIPNSVTTIGNGAFSGCSLISITIPSSVTTIGSSAFENCTSLDSVYYLGTLEEWKSINIGNNYANPMDYATHLFIKIDGEWVDVASQL